MPTARDLEENFIKRGIELAELLWRSEEDTSKDRMKQTQFPSRSEYAKVRSAFLDAVEAYLYEGEDDANTL